MATVPEDWKLTKKEARSILTSVARWFNLNPKKRSCPTRLGALGEHKFTRANYVKQIARLSK